MSTLQAVNHWHQTRWGLLLGGILELILAYAIGSWAIDTGSWWQYLGMVILLVGGLQNITKLIKTTLITSK